LLTFSQLAQQPGGALDAATIAANKKAWHDKWDKSPSKVSEIARYYRAYLHYISIFPGHFLILAVGLDRY